MPAGGAVQGRAASARHSKPCQLIVVPGCLQPPAARAGAARAPAAHGLPAPQHCSPALLSCSAHAPAPPRWLALVPGNLAADCRCRHCLRTCSEPFPALPCPLLSCHRSRWGMKSLCTWLDSWQVTKLEWVTLEDGAAEGTCSLPICAAQRFPHQPPSHSRQRVCVWAPTAPACRSPCRRGSD